MMMMMYLIIMMMTTVEMTFSDSGLVWHAGNITSQGPLRPLRTTLKAYYISHWGTIFKTSGGDSHRSTRSVL